MRGLRVQVDRVEPKAEKRQTLFFLEIFIRSIIPQPFHVERDHVHAEARDKEVMQRVKYLLPAEI
jgi:hypothetical protein